MGVVDDSPTWLRDYESIEVDTSGLDQFAGSVNAEVEGNFEPHTQRLFRAYELGVTFGFGNESGNVQAARNKHRDALTATGESMAAYINASRILIEAIRRAAEEYASADALSSARARDVEGILGQAITDAENARLAAEQAAQAAAEAAARNGYGRNFI